MERCYSKSGTILGSGVTDCLNIESGGFVHCSYTGMIISVHSTMSNYFAHLLVAVAALKQQIRVHTGVKLLQTTSHKPKYQDHSDVFRNQPKFIIRTTKFS